MNVANLISVISACKLIDAENISRINSKASAYTDPKALASDLVRAGLLTSFQAKTLLQGRGKDLLIGPYVIIDLLGEGGMGQVYKAKNVKLNSVIALKLIHEDRTKNPTVLKRFQREILAASKLNHINIVRAVDADEINGQLALAMEYVKGDDLSKLVKEKGPLPVEEACDYIKQTALGLQHAHEKGLVHRDIKPQNLLLSITGVVKILDMGLARRMEQSEDTTTLTQEGTVMGTADYLPPEQAISSHTVDIRADIYSLGATFYYLLAGRVPFPGGTLTEKLIKCQLEEPTPIEKLRQDVPPHIASIVRKMMAKKAKDRYQVPAEVVAALDTPVPQPKKAKKPKLLLIGAAVTSIFMLLLSIGVFIILSAPPTVPDKPEPVVSVGKTVYLSELQENVDLNEDGRQFGKNNQTKMWNGQTISAERLFKGRKSKHDLFTHPGISSHIKITYAIGGKYNKFSSVVGLSDTVLPQYQQNLTFSVYGDGALLWKSKPVTKVGENEPFDISVRGVKVLEIRVDSQFNQSVHAMWAEPKLN